MKSTTSCTYPIIAALVAVTNELKPGSKWKPDSHQQKQFISGIFCNGEGDIKNLPEIKTKVSNNVNILNQLLADNGFSIEFNPFESPNEFGVVSIFKLILEWLEKGKITMIHYQDKEYLAVQIPNDCVKFFSSPNHSFPVAVIETKTGDEVLLSMADSSFENFDLDYHIDRIFQNLKPRSDLAGLVFPMVDLVEKVDITWLMGMTAFLGEDVVGKISRALQETKFSMDENGAKVESVVVLSVYKACVERIVPRHVINQPFFAVVRRKGLNLPIFSGYIAPDCWKKP